MVKAIEPDDADVPQTHTHITIIQPPLPAVVKLLVERLKLTSQLLVDYSACMSDPTSTLEPGQINDANRQIVEILLGIPWTDDGEVVS